MTVISMMNNALDLKLLQCFAVLMAERSVSRAAARLNLSQPAMSHALGRLRALFDDPLLLKGHGHMTPTARALELEPQVREVISGTERLTHRPAAFDPATARMLFTVMAPEFVEYMLAPPLHARIGTQAPGIEVDFRTTDLERAFGWLERGDLDVRLGWLPEPPPALRHKLLFRDRLVCIARKGHPEIQGSLTAAQFVAARHVRVSLPRMTVSMAAIDGAVRALGARIDTALHVQNAFAMARLVADSDLLGATSRRLATQLAIQFPLQVLPLPLTVPDVRIAMYWHERTHKEPSHRWFRNVLADAARSV
jgi:DNA-binding transcriptional LysR family regulator